MTRGDFFSRSVRTGGFEGSENRVQLLVLRVAILCDRERDRVCSDEVAICVYADSSCLFYYTSLSCVWSSSSLFKGPVLAVIGGEMLVGERNLELCSVLDQDLKKITPRR